MGTHHCASALSASNAGDWVQAHAALSRLSRERAALDAEDGRWLLCAWRSAGGRLDDDALLLALARHVLGGPRDEGRSSYQRSLHVCAVCSGGAQLAAGELVPVDEAVVDMAACDAQHLGDLLPLAAAPVTAAPRAANENAILLPDAESRENAADASGDERTATHPRSAVCSARFCSRLSNRSGA